MHGGICQRVRDELDPKLLASFFDDTFIVDDFDLALKGVLKLKQLFHEVGLEVCLDKSSVYSTTPLTEEQLGELAEHEIRDAGEGILLLGTPLGSDSFIRQYLASETNSVMDILGDIQTAVDVGHLNDRLATHQGIYHLLRDCGNQLLRHLLRTVDPRLTCEAFRQLDTRTLGEAMHLFEIDRPQLTEVVKTRLLLPGTLSGLALTPYCLAAVPAFLGCMMSVGRRLAIPVDEPQRFIPGFDQALNCLKDQLPEEDIPSPEQFFPNSMSEDEPQGVSHLSRKLLRAQQTKIYKDLDLVASGLEKTFLVVTSHKTCGDFLFAPLTDPFCRMARSFKIYTRLYLGLEVTSKVCNIGKCNGVAVHPYGAHSQHAPGKVTSRHHALRDCISSFISFQATAHNTPHEVRKEVFLDDVGYEKLPTATDESRAKCDFMVTKRETNYHVFADICVVHPRMDASIASEPLSAAIAAEKAKFKRYCDNYHVQEAQIKPLVFETFGGWTPGTYEYLYNVIKGIAGEEDYLSSKLWRKLRNRIGVTLARGESELLLRLNVLNPLVQHSQSPISSTTPLTPTFSGSPSPSTSRRRTPSSPQRRSSQSRTVRSNSHTSTSSSEDLPAPTTTTTTRRQQLRRELNRTSSVGSSAVNRIQRGSASS